jgi:hypothetical protein
LAVLRALPSADALAQLAIHLKADSTFHPLKQATSRRWHVRTASGEFEILTTGPKWYDTRAKKGGGGAIDLAMHVLGVSFVDAVRQLTTAEHGHGPDHS